MPRSLRILGALLALAAGLELGTRVDELVRWGTPLTSMAASINDIIIIDSTGARGMPAAHYRQFTFNSKGFRGPEPSADRPRILVLGASETFGLYEPSGQEYPRQLQDSLAARGCVVDVVNVGLPGFTLPTLTVTYSKRLRDVHAAAAIVYPTPVQYLEVDRPAFHPRTPAAPSVPSRVQLRAIRRVRDHLRSVIPAWLRTYLRARETERLQRDLNGVSPWTSVPPDRLLAFEEDLTALLDSLAASGVKALVATHANAITGDGAADSEALVAWGKFYPRADKAVIPRFEREANSATRRIAQERGIPMSDIARHMHAFPGGLVFADFSHFTAHGSAIVAGRLSDDLLGTIGCPRERH